MKEYVLLAKYQNYSRAAEDLYITQPALSRHIASIEEELDTSLINRNKNFFQLTKSGEIVLERFEHILGDYENMLEQISRQSEIERGELHVGYLGFDRDFYVSKIFRSFRQKYPEIKLVTHSCQPNDLENGLINGRFDAVFIYGLGEKTSDRFRRLTFLKTPLILIFHKSHKFAGYDEL